MEEERAGFTLLNEGKKLFGITHRPLGLKKCPIVLFLHGFAGNKVGRYRLYVQMAEKLVQQGIGAVRFDCRGCGDSEGAFQEITIAGKLSDALCAYHFVRSIEWADSDRLGLIGISLGGAIAMQLAENIQAIKSLALWAPLALGQQWILDWQRQFPEQAKKGYRKGAMEAGDDFQLEFRNLSLQNCVSKTLDVPLLHLQGLRDTNVSPKNAELYKQWRSCATAETRFVVLEQTGHDFIEEYETVLQETTEWFKRTL